MQLKMFYYVVCVLAASTNVHVLFLGNTKWLHLVVKGLIVLVYSDRRDSENIKHK
jgi:hypothetical protein